MAAEPTSTLEPFGDKEGYKPLESISFCGYDPITSFVSSNGSSLCDFDEALTRTLQGRVDSAWNKKIAARSTFQTDETIDNNKNDSNPYSLVFSVDTAGTWRMDDCMQIFWVKNKNSPVPAHSESSELTERAIPIGRLCLRVHIANVASAYPVGCLYDEAFRAVVSPSYSVSSPPRIELMNIPPFLRDYSSFEKNREATRRHQSNSYLSPDDQRNTITAEIFYDLLEVDAGPNFSQSDSDTGAKWTYLVRDSSASQFFFSRTKIQHTVDKDDPILPKLYEILEEKNLGRLKHTLNPQAIRDALSESGHELPDEPSEPFSAKSQSPDDRENHQQKRPLTFQAFMGVHIARLTYKKIKKGTPQSFPEQTKPTDPAQTFFSRMSALGNPSQWNTKVEAPNKKNKQIMTIWVEPRFKPHESISLINEFTKLAFERIAAHPVFRHLLLRKVYGKEADILNGEFDQRRTFEGSEQDNVDNFAATLNWLCRGTCSEKEWKLKALQSGEPATVYMSSLLTNLLGVSPFPKNPNPFATTSKFLEVEDLKSTCEELTQPDLFEQLQTLGVYLSFTHPGRDYLNLMQQRLLVAYINDGSRLASEFEKATFSRPKGFESSPQNELLPVPIFEKKESDGLSNSERKKLEKKERELNVQICEIKTYNEELKKTKQFYVKDLIARERLKVYWGEVPNSSFEEKSLRVDALLRDTLTISSIKSLLNNEWKSVALRYLLMNQNNTAEIKSECVLSAVVERHVSEKVFSAKVLSLSDHFEGRCDFLNFEFRQSKFSDVIVDVVWPTPSQSLSAGSNTTSTACVPQDEKETELNLLPLPPLNTVLPILVSYDKTSQKFIGRVFFSETGVSPKLLASATSCQSNADVNPASPTLSTSSQLE